MLSSWSTDGTLYAALTPGHWESFGAASAIYDPSEILNPNTGLANVLTNISNPKSESRETINGQSTVKITGTASADAVNGLAPQLKATQPLPATVWIQETGDHQLVQAKLDQSPGNSVQMTLSNWNAPVQVTKPPVSRMTAPHAGRGVAIGAGSLAVLLGALDTYVVVTIMRDIINTVGIPINQLQRITSIVTWYLLGYIAAMPLLGRASDRFGRKLLLQASLAAFIVGSVVTALSTDLHVLVVGRTIQGVASGALLPVTLALGADLWSQRNRAGMLGGIGAAQELGSVLGPLYGIFIVWLTSRWQDVFWINVPLALAAMVMIQFSLPSQDRSADPEKIDVVGGLLLAITLGLAVIGLYNPAPNGQQVLPSYGPPLYRGGRRRGDLRAVGAVCAYQADRAHRGALRAVPVRARRVAVRRCGADGDAGRRRAVRPGRAR